MTPSARYHVLLIGIDDYRARPLGGCINDIDAVQDVLRGPRMGLPGDWIRRLASPRPGQSAGPAQARADHGAEIAEQPATLVNLRAALAELASDRVAENDRVFIYFAGHGARVTVRFARAREFHSEALVMADHDPARPGSGMLFDFELNQALRAITERTHSVTVVLDCCHAAGVTRGPGELLPPDVVASADPVARCLDLDSAALVDLPPAPPDANESRPGLVAAADHCHVVAACLGHERANEDGASDSRHGLLTRAIVAALDDVPDSTLHELSWGRIWQTVCAVVSERNPAQHPRMAGSAGRAVFSGPPVERDPGIPVRRVGDAFQIAAGTLADITKGAVLAIYSDRPPYFPPLGSAEDLRARIGCVRVDRAKLATATAITEGRAFEPPADARGRLIAAGHAARLRCAVLPQHHGVEAQLRTSPRLEVVSPASGPEVWLEYDRGRWFVTDSVYSTRADRPVLFSLHPSEIDRARRVLEHYCEYSLPLRMAARSTDLAGSLDLRVRLHQEARANTANVVQGGNSQHVAATLDTYVLRVGTRVCFEVRNHSPHRLRVSLVNSAASGKVQFLGDEIIDPSKHHVFYAGTGLDVPFEMVLPPGLDHGLDRLIAIGRTALACDLDHLRVDRSFADVARVMRSSRPVDLDEDIRAPPPLEQWTVAQAIIETRR